MSTADKLFIASADGHVGLETAQYREYVDPDHLEAFDDFVAEHREKWTPERDESVLSASVRDWFRGNPRFESGGMDSVFDPVRRLKELDEDGVAVEVLFPDDQNLNSQPWLSGLAPQGLEHPYPSELRRAGARAYNRWLAEFCAAAPDRLIGAMLLGPLDDVDAAIDEMRRAHASGLRHTLVLPLVYYEPLYHHPRYDPFWQACCDLDLTVSVHLADGGPDWYGDTLWAGAIYTQEAFFYAQRPLWCMVYGGVFERFPELRVTFTEQLADWVPGLLAKMDGTSAAGFLRASQVAPMAHRPSELFHRQCFVANSLMTRSDIDRREAIGTDVLVWGSDFPHHEGMWPATVERMRGLFEGVPEADARAILGGNFLRAYKVDRPALDPLVDQIGLVPAQLGLT